MNKKIILSLVLASTCIPSMYATLIDVKIQIGVATCTGGGNQCNVTINAVGDVVTFDIAGYPVKDLGELKADQLITLDLPQQLRGAKVFSFIPTSGDLSGTEIYLLIQNVRQRVGTRRANKTVFKLSRQLMGAQPDQWIELGDIEIDKRKTLKNWPFIVSPNGTFISFDTRKIIKGGPSITIDTDKPLPQGVQKVVFLAGNKELNE